MVIKISAFDRFPSTEPTKSYEKNFVNFISKFFKEINDMEAGENEALIFGEILFRYPLTKIEELPQVLPHNLFYKKIENSEIKNSLDKIIDLKLFRKNKKENNFIEPGRDPGKYEKHLKNLLNSHNIRKDLKEKFIDHIDFWKNYINSFFLERLEDYCQRINNRSSKEGLATLEQDLDDIDGYSEIILVTFSTETIWPLLENSILKALRNGIEKYRILLIDPNLALELETPRAKKQVEEGINRIKELKKVLKKENFTRKDINKIKLRLIKYRKDAHFFGVLKIAKEKTDKKDLFRCLVKRTGIERGVNAIVLRGHYKNNTLFALTKSYIDSVWKRSRSTGIRGFLKKYSAEFIGTILILLVVIFCYFISPTFISFIFFLIGIGLKLIWDFIKYLKKRMED